jgi:hypothetical protein
MTSILKVDTIQDTAGNNIINESSDTITIGASGDTVNIVGTLQNNGSGLVSGITEADQWRITANRTGTSDITANWERNDTDFDYIGTGMTESSGIFTFPATGIYLVTINARGTNSSSSQYTQIAILATTDNSTYVARSGVYSSFGFANHYQGWYANTIFDVTSTTNCKVKFSVTQNESGTLTLEGDTNNNRTYATFIRLGNT